MIRNANQFDFGGGERFPVDTSAVLKDLGYQVLIVSRNARLLDYARERGLTHIRGWWWSHQNWGGWRTILLPIYLSWQILLFFWYLQLFLRKNPDIVHIQSRDDFIAATLAARLLNKRVIWTDHADLKYIYVNYSHRIKNFVGKAVFACSRLAHTVTLVSNSEKSLIAKALGRSVPENYQVIYNGVSSIPVKLVARNPKHKKDVIFACTSRLVTTKGIGELIRAFIKTQASHPESRLYLFGEGPEEAMFRKMAEGNDRIHFMGFPSNSLSQVADCDVFVHPSYHEGFSISLVEATKLGLPIIACPVGGNPEIVKDRSNGLLVEVKNVDALADAMIELAKNATERRQFGSNALKTYQQGFILEDIIKEKFVPIYE